MIRKKSHRRGKGLVIGLLERVGSGVFDVYGDEITDLVDHRHGIYSLYKNNKLYYVGLARNLRSRLKQHLRDRHAGMWNYFSLYLVRSERNLRDLESLTIRIAYPKGNKVRGKFDGAPNLKKILQKKMKQEAIAEINGLLGRLDIAGKREPKATLAALKFWKARRTLDGAKKPLKGLINKALRMRYKGKTYHAWVYRSGTIKIKETGELFKSPSGAAGAIRKCSSDGWWWWEYKNSKGEWKRLSELRK